MPRPLFFLAVFAVLLGTGQAFAAPACTFAAPVCAARDAVYRISAYDPAASAVRIAPTLLVTNRHVVADEAKATVYLETGERIDARVLPTSFYGDLILLEADLPPGPVLKPGGDASGSGVFTIGYDLATRSVMVNEPGLVLLAPDAGVPLARLQHRAKSMAGNSGGALVDEDGELVGIATSGGDGRSEAIPASAIDILKRESGPAHSKESGRIGQAYRICDEALDDARRVRGALQEQISATLEAECVAGGNKVQIELAAQAFGQRGDFDRSITLFKRALAQDPLSISTRLGLATTYHLAGRFADEVPLVRALLDVIPEDPTLQRYAIQAGKWGDAPDLAARGLELIRRYSPEQAAGAERFLATDLPPPTSAPRLK